MNDSASDDMQDPPANKNASSSMAHHPPPPGNLLSGRLGIFIFVILFSTAGYLTWHTLTTWERPIPDPPEVTYMCSETMKTFQHKPKMGESIPILSPYTNRNTGYVVESCYWSKDGKRKTLPTYVILNSYLGKKGPTVCPDCGRLVYPHNPVPPQDTPVAADSNEAASKSPGQPSARSKPVITP